MLIIMKELIAYCGLDCETCEARLATIHNDDEAKARVAEKWSSLNQISITAEMIHCEGCRVDGVKTVYCDALCPIRQCAMQKSFETCADCADLHSCEKISPIIGNNPSALENLKNT